MATANATTTKRKPPTFQHLPIDRAKKLKRKWVEVQKIKSKWKAEKRKEGIPSTRRLTAEDEAESEAEEPTEIAEGQRKIPEDEDQSDADASGGSATESEGSQEAESNPSQAEQDYADEDARPSKLPRFSSSRGRNRGRGRDRRGRGGQPRPDDHQDKPSLRELNKMAYSRSSLHTYKSKHGPEDSSHRGRGRGRGRESFPHRGRGRGQPDMRLRMNAMLEKIKRDLV
ncbi:hypothetical protein NM688_g7223 [Phlebia brevispora]|uniref:Uncharacterized protein n=1 Tax=Phlebia brevispora TaxID=194682 RepID=A0ACC1S7R4_9APHY|nr:hypothetical protein NM688_g7223 [Phlebia brevispora]